MNTETIFTAVRALVPKLSQKQVDSINAIAEQIQSQNVTDKRHIAYIIATAYHETAATLLPVVEYGSEKYLKSKAYYPYIGRGYCQLTWDYNYQKYSNLMGIDFMNRPELLLNVKNSAFILVHGMVNGVFTGKKLSDFTTFTGMRRIINGTDKAALIAGYAEKVLPLL